MEFVQLNLTFENRDWLLPVSDFFLGQEVLSVEVMADKPSMTILLRPGMDHPSLMARFATYRDIIGIPEPETTSGLLPDTDWVSVFKQHFRRFRMNRYVHVVPEWEATDTDRSSPDTIVVEPGQAFGTGLHPTTALAAEYVAEYVDAQPACSLLDVGTGSGILAILALKRGAGPVIAFDVDPLCADAIHHHLSLNGRTDHDVMGFVGTHDALGMSGNADLVVINIIETIIRRILPDILEWVGDRVVLSGVLERDAIAFEQFIRELGLKVLDTRTRSEWICYLCER